MLKIKEEDRKRPLCYDPARKKFIFYDDIITGQEKIIPVDKLSKNDLKKLIIERWRVLPDNSAPIVGGISGPHYSRNDVISAIERDEPFGLMTIEADKSYLQDLLNDIQKNI